MPPRVARSVSHPANPAVWEALGEELPQPDGQRPRDPYWEQGCHPDVVGRLWDQLGSELPDGARAQARGRPVLAHAETDRIIAFARGTAYAVWVVAEDRPAAQAAGASSVRRWGSGATSDLTEIGVGWIWGRWYAAEAAWIRHAYAAARA
ncbi:MAG TPA: hypothetical protein VG405_12025 [Solirubrobacteraceae bacterium]|nr:hypothetical protein [Solirubrobacteraceae bacterium]